MGDEIEAAIAATRSGEPGEAERGIATLRRLAEDAPDDAGCWYQLAGALDTLGYEEEAWPNYARVHALGVDRLPEAERPEFYVGAGSTLRNIGRIEESRAMLAEGRVRYPAVRALTVFAALTEISAGNQARAIDLLLEALLAEEDGDTSLRRYRRALVYYAGEVRSGSDGTRPA